MFKFFLQLVFLSFSLVLWHDGLGTETNAIVKNGIADLRNCDLQKNSIQLNGAWAFSWKQLLSPEQKNAYTDYVTFPSLWKGQDVHGQKLGSSGYATYQLTILLPAKRNLLALNIPDFYASYRLYINGKEFSANGHPDSASKNYTPHWINITNTITDLSDTLVLTLQVANFSHAKGGPYKPITIGDNERLQSLRETSIATDFLLSGCLFMGGLFFFGLYLFGKNDKATLYFSLFCMLYSYRIVGTGMYALHSVFPHLSWEITVRLEYFTLFGSILLFIQYVRELYPYDIYKPIIKALSWFCLLVTITPILLPTTIFTSIINPFLMVMFFCIVYVLIVFIKAYKHKRPAAEYGLVSIAVLMLVMLLINLQYFGIVVPSGKIIFAGYIAFFFLQSLILSFRFAFTLQLARQQAEEGLKSKSEFLATMSHEIRTPLNSVIGMSHLMLRNDPRKDQKEQLDVLLFSAGNLLSIVNNILDYSKIEAGRISFEHIDMDVKQILRHIIASFRNAANEKEIDLKLLMPEKFSHELMGDPTRFSQVISNLVGNAIKFTERGEVLVALIVEEETTTQVKIKFSIKDTGIGISPEKQSLIFDQFTQADSSTSRSYGGTGLGLAISKKILELQGAQLSLESNVGQGAEFFFTQTFSVSRTVQPPLKKIPVQTKRTKDKPLAGVVILLVEDNPMNVFVAKGFLESWGARIDVAENGEQAVAKLDTEVHRIILMDLHMPVMDGYEATRRIREQGINIPIIALTASLPNEIKEEIKGLGIDSIVLKPFVPDELFQAVVQHSLVEQ